MVCLLCSPSQSVLVSPSEPGPAILRLPGSGGADGSGAGGCGALRGARRAQRRQNTNITKVPCLKGMRGKLRPSFRLGNKEKGRLRPGRRGNWARPETGAGRTASRRGLRWSRWLSGQRAAWPTRLGPGRARKPAGRGRAGTRWRCERSLLRSSRERSVGGAGGSGRRRVRRAQGRATRTAQTKYKHNKGAMAERDAR